MKITFSGILVFLLLVIAFFAWFGCPPLSDNSLVLLGGAFMEWLRCSTLFVIGAGIACFGEKEYCMFPPVSLRWLFIAFGAIIMFVAAMGMHLMRPEAEDASANNPAQNLPVPDYRFGRAK